MATQPSDGQLGTGEALQLLQLAQQGGGAYDMLLHIEARGAPVEGESERRFSDGKARMDILGYELQATLRDAAGGQKAATLLSHLHVVRRSDSATSSIASLLRSQTLDLKLRLSVFRAGGDNSVDAQPTMELEFEGARVAGIAMLTGGPAGGPCEVIRFGYRVLKIHAAPQRHTGATAAVRTCELSMA